MMRFFDLAELGRQVQPGCKLALPTNHAGVSMAMIRELLRNRCGDLHVVCVPISGLHADMLIGAGLVATIETSAISLGEVGGAPCFMRAVADNTVRVLDATCPAIYAGLIAAQKGMPFLPLRGLIGTDVLANRPDWPVFDNPCASGPDPVVAVPAIVPDIAIFHAPVADRFGNVLIGRRRELGIMAYAARRTLCTVERVVDGNLLASEVEAAAVLPSLYVDAIAVASRGAAPYGLWDEYDTDTVELARYARMARSPGGFRDYMVAAGLLPEHA